MKGFLVLFAIFAAHSCNAIPIEQSSADTTTLLNILNHLTIEQLGKIADENTQLIPLITERVLIKKYRIHEKVISIKKDTTPYTGDSDEISEIGAATRFLRLFGASITKLKFTRNGFSTEDADTIARHIAQFGENSITTLQLSDAIPDDVYFFSHVLLNVQSLTISSDRSEWTNFKNKIHFTSVKSFTLLDNHGLIWNENDRPFTFDQLEAFAFESPVLDFTKFGLFFYQNKQLKSLNVPNNVETSYDYLLDLIRGLKDLESIDLKWSQSVSAKQVQRLLKSGKLNQVKFITTTSVVQLADTFATNMPEQWHLSEIFRPLDSSQTTVVTFKRTL